MIQEWPQVDLKMRQVPDGLIIEQAGQSYLARKWRLSDDLSRVTSLAIAGGLECCIRHNHPKPNHRLGKGVEYIGFSRTPSERWVLVLDQFSCDNKESRHRIRQLTFEKHYRYLLDSAGIPTRAESAGGQNVFVSMGHVEDAIKLCACEAEQIEGVLGAREWEATKARLGIVTEAVLESYLLGHWEELPLLSQLRVIQNQVRCPQGQIDILAASSSGGRVIIELKRNKTGPEVIEQAAGYAESLRGITPDLSLIIIARDYFPGIRAAAESCLFPVRLLQFKESNGAICLTPYSGL